MWHTKLITTLIVTLILDFRASKRRVISGNYCYELSPMCPQNYLIFVMNIYSKNLNLVYVELFRKVPLILWRLILPFKSQNMQAAITIPKLNCGCNIVLATFILSRYNVILKDRGSNYEKTVFIIINLSLI